MQDVLLRQHRCTFGGGVAENEDLRLRTPFPDTDCLFKAGNRKEPYADVIELAADIPLLVVILPAVLMAYKRVFCTSGGRVKAASAE